MTDQSTPNLPARDFEATEQFYAGLGFEASYRASGWMILRRGGLVLEFFPYPDLDPATSSFGCCFRLDDVNAFHRSCVDAGVPEGHVGIPRIVPPRVEDWGGTVGYLIDIDGSLIRLVENKRDA